jgi:lipase ATG15
MIDDRAQNFQQIRCETPMADIIGCHTITRTLCEIIYSCGTQERPAICECVTQFGYPPPVPKFNVTRTFEEACNITDETAAA